MPLKPGKSNATPGPAIEIAPESDPNCNPTGTFTANNGASCGVCRIKRQPAFKHHAIRRRGKNRTAHIQPGVRSEDDAVGIEQKQVRRPVCTQQSVNIRNRISRHAAENILHARAVVERDFAVGGNGKRLETVKKISPAQRAAVDARALARRVTSDLSEPNVPSGTICDRTPRRERLETKR